MQRFLYLKGPFLSNPWCTLLWQAFQAERFYAAGLWPTIDHTWGQRVIEGCFADWQSE